MFGPESKSVSAFEAKTRLGRLLDRVQSGEELVITRHGQPVARLVPAFKPDQGEVADALATFKQVRDSISVKGSKVSRKQVRDWIEEGRR